MRTLHPLRVQRVASSSKKPMLATRPPKSKKAIEEGNYKVDLDKTSHKMAQDLLS
ncbi:hypothetical protein HBZS_119320 [Helicobacter bizzozeronii CCUG 35545]|nr:hypothetical protein HBZS_119320 [Helicobacter bizzozeronii CCUG 35545]